LSALDDAGIDSPDIELSAEHWEVIQFLRDDDEYEFAPAVRILVKTIGKKLGADKAGRSSEWHKANDQLWV
jgi:TusE/DsrC/DsvC family sulfur relay protein